MILVILKLLVVLFFLIMFIRRPSAVWGIGLLTVTTAALLDTLLGTFNREEMLAELGFSSMSSAVFFWPARPRGSGVFPDHG